MAQQAPGSSTLTLGDESDLQQAPTSGCTILVVSGTQQDRGNYIRLNAGHVSVGTADACDLTLTDPTVSRQHADFIMTDSGIRIEDVGSTNGTRYLDSRIDSALLPMGAQVRLGKTVLALLPPTSGTGLQASSATCYGGLKGESLAIRRLFAILERLESCDAPVLIHGETGTGKELVAAALHQHSVRSKAPYVVLDCGSLPRELVESEVFGHVRGAFTGASSDRPGAFEQAHGGTLFLDEIGELPIALQPKLLRALESGEVKRVGENRYRQVDVRVVAATHCDLGAAVDAGAFRQDLYYRLAVIKLTVPPLRERLDDIPILVRHFAEKMHHDAEGFSAELFAVMRQHTWPGNVRELRNAVQRLVSLGELTGELSGGAQPFHESAIDPAKSYKQAREEVVQRFEGAYARAILKAHNGNISAAARAAGIARTHFRNLMKKHGLKASS